MANKFASLKMSGDIKAFEKFIKVRTFPADMDRAIRRGTIRNSLFLIKMIKDGIRNREFDSNSELTLAMKNSDLPLLNQRNLWKAIDYKLLNSFTSEIGIIADKGSTGSQFGHAKSQINLKLLVELMEEGYTITVTEKMKKAIAIALSETESKSTTASSRTKGMKTGSSYVVPPRKVFTTVWDEGGNVDKVLQQNWRKALEDMWKFRGAKDGEEKDR